MKLPDTPDYECFSLEQRSSLEESMEVVANNNLDQGCDHAEIKALDYLRNILYYILDNGSFTNGEWDIALDAALKNDYVNNIDAQEKLNCLPREMPAQVARMLFRCSHLYTHMYIEIELVCNSGNIINPS